MINFSSIYNGNLIIIPSDYLKDNMIIVSKNMYEEIKNSDLNKPSKEKGKIWKKLKKLIQNMLEH